MINTNIINTKKKKNLNYNKLISRIKYGIYLIIILFPCLLYSYYSYLIFISLKLLALNELIKNKIYLQNFYIIMLSFLFFLNTWDPSVVPITIVSLIGDLMQFSGFFLKDKYKTKISNISPNKCIQGYIIGYFLSMIFIHKILIFIKFTLLQNTIFFLGGCTGDILASYIKRKLKIKDFSNCLEEHGGILDRFDSVLFNFTMRTFLCYLKCL